MKRAEVVRLARAKWGKKAVVEERRDALDPETRAILKKELDKLRAQEPQPPPEVVAYNKRHAEWYVTMKTVRDRLHCRRRYRIEENLGLGNMIHGDGDTWEEAARNAGLIPKVETVSTE